MDFIVRQAGDGNSHPAFHDDVPDVDKQTDLGNTIDLEHWPPVGWLITVKLPALRRRYNYRLNTGVCNEARCRTKNQRYQIRRFLNVR